MSDETLTGREAIAFVQERLLKGLEGPLVSGWERDLKAVSRLKHKTAAQALTERNLTEILAAARHVAGMLKAAIQILEHSQQRIFTPEQQLQVIIPGSRLPGERKNGA